MMRKVKAGLKNMSQRVKQVLSRFFPGYIKRVYFKDLDRTPYKGKLEVNTSEIELLFICDLIPPDAIYIDIGANRGDYVFVLEKSNKCKKIFAVEPIPELNRQLQHLFPKQQICPEAISNQNGNQQFRIPYIQSRYFDTRGTLENFTENNQNATRIINVETITLDDFVNKYSISNVDFIKMDIEGHEYSALQGAKKVMQSMRPFWMIEIEQRHHVGLDIKDIFIYIQAYGYTGYYFDGIEKCFSTIETFDAIKHQQVNRMNDKKAYINNFIFVPNERQAHYLEIFNDIIKRFA